jgi:hypothetical protein
MPSVQRTNYKFLDFRRVVNAEYSLLGISQSSEIYKRTFRNSVSVPSSWVGRNDAQCVGSSGIYTEKGGEAMKWRDPIGEREEWGW